MAVYYKQYTVTTAAASLATIFGSGLPDNHLAEVDMLAKSTNSGHVFVGGSNVTNVPANAGVDMAPGVGFSMLPGGSRHILDASKIYVVGTASDVLFITLIA